MMLAPQAMPVMQPVYQYMPQPQPINQRVRMPGNSGGIYNKMRTTKQNVRNAPTIESRVRLPNQRNVATTSPVKNVRIEDRLKRPLKVQQTPQQ